MNYLNRCRPRPSRFDAQSICLSLSLIVTTMGGASVLAACNPPPPPDQPPTPTPDQPPGTPPPDVTPEESSPAGSDPAAAPAGERMGPGAAAAPGIPEATAGALAAGETITLDAKSSEPVWQRAIPVTWTTDWAGQPSPVKTEVRLAYADGKALYLLWELEGAALANSQQVPVDVEHTKLWQDDAAEIFLGSPELAPQQYYEIEVGPFGHYFDLAINHHLPEGDPKRDDIAWSSGLRQTVARDEAAKTVTIEMALEAPDIAKLMKPGARLPMGLYRIEGKNVPDVPDGRHYLAWSPTLSEKPAFHVPERFGRLLLEK